MSLTDFPRTPLLRMPEPVEGHIMWVKDESACPTGTFKDRLGWALARQVVGSPIQDLLITCITLGNTLISVAHFLNSVDESIRPQVLGLLPNGFSQRVLGPDTAGCQCTGADVVRACQAKGAMTVEVDLESAYLSESDIREIGKKCVPSATESRDISYGIGEDAYASILQEALDDLPAIPSVVLVSVGAGILFDECVRVVEERRLPTVVVGVSVTEPSSVADKIYGYYSPYFADLCTQGRAFHSRFPRHPVLRVEDRDVLSALQFTKMVGQNAEPSSVAALVPILRKQIEMPSGDVLWINTGNGVIPRCDLP